MIEDKLEYYRVGNTNLKLKYSKSVWPPSKFSLWLAQYLARSLHGEGEILDVGIGSGILSIIAHLKGAKEVIGIDINPAALKTSKENWLLNRKDHSQILVIKGGQPLSLIANNMGWNNKFDFVICNPPGLPANFLAYNKTSKIPSYVKWNESGTEGRDLLDDLLLNSPYFLKQKGRLVFITSSRIEFTKTKNLLNKDFIWRIVWKKNNPISPIYLPYLDFWLLKNKEQGSLIYKKNSTYFEYVYLIDAQKK